MMKDSAVHWFTAPFTDNIPAELYFRAAQMPARAAYPMHSHTWGEFVYSFSGVMEVSFTDKHFIAPREYGIWVPPGAVHNALNNLAACHCSVYVAASLAARMPTDPCAIIVTPLIRAILDDLHNTPLASVQAPEYNRLLNVLLDKLCQAPKVGSYLPGSNDPMLSSILQTLQKNPGDDRPLKEWARHVNTTQRTLLRRCHRELGMSLAEWKQRAKVIHSFEMLKQGITIERISFDLGYCNTSSFISMFRKVIGQSPDEYRRNNFS